MVQQGRLPKNFPKKLILDSTVVIQILAKDWFLKDDCVVIIPANIAEELKSFESNLVLSLLESKQNILFLSPSSSSFSKAANLAKQAGEYGRLSSYDLTIIALAIENPEFTIISDDNAIQNLCKIFNIKIESSFFKITKKKKYFWKCTVCGSKFTKNLDHCPDCGSPLKRYFRKV